MQPSDDFTPEVHRRPGETVVRRSQQLQRRFDIAGFGERLRIVDDPGELG